MANACAYCKKELNRKIFCNNSHRSMYYQKLIFIPNKREEIKPDVEKELLKCNICRQIKEVERVEYLLDGEKTVDNMCLSCKKRIPSEMRISEKIDIPTNSTYKEISNFSDHFNPVPKPTKKKK